MTRDEIEKKARESGQYLAEAFEARLESDAIKPDGDFKPEYLDLLAGFAANIYEDGYLAGRDDALEEAASTIESHAPALDGPSTFKATAALMRWVADRVIRELKC